METLLGAGVRARAVPLLGSIPELPLAEAGVVSSAVEKRRREFAFGRRLARALLAELGRPVESIPRGPDRAPIWPAGAWGCISHTDELVVAAVALTGDGLGLDLEGAEPLPPALFPHVLRPEERARLEGRDAGRLAKIVFSAKEAFYKAQHRHTGLLLDFFDVSVRLDEEARRFSLEVHRDDARALLPSCLEGGWIEPDPFVLTAIRVSKPT